MSIFLRELLNLHPLPYKWLSPTVGTFEFNGKQFGIVLEEQNVRFPTRVISVVNITFGVVINTKNPITVDNINTALTNFGQPRTVMTTVANACVDNPQLIKNDIIIVAATDQAKQRRVGIYGLAVTELANRLPQYKFSYRATTGDGAILIVESRIELTQEEVDYVSKELLGK